MGTNSCIVFENDSLGIKEKTVINPLSPIDTGNENDSSKSWKASLILPGELSVSSASREIREILKELEVPTYQYSISLEHRRTKRTSHCDLHQMGGNHTAKTRWSSPQRVNYPQHSSGEGDTRNIKKKKKKDSRARRRLGRWSRKHKGLWYSREKRIGFYLL